MDGMDGGVKEMRDLKSIPMDEMTDDEITAMNELLWAEYADDENKRIAEVARVNSRLFKAIKSLRGEKFVQDLNDVVKECEVVDAPYEIVNTPQGKYQHESFRTIKGFWVKQWSVGDSGDSYNGYIAIKIKRNKYLQMYYSC